MKRVARLVRVSTAHLEQADSPRHQLAYLAAELDREGWSDAGLVYEAELTGAVIVDRPDIRRMLQDAADGRFDAILLKSISRLGRDTLGLLMVKRMLDDLQVELVALADGYRSGRDPELIFLVHAERAQAGRQEIAKNVRAGIVQAARRGIWPAGTLPFGLRKESRFDIVPDPETAPIVQVMFALRRQGWGAARIARHLNGEVRVKAPAWWHLRERIGRLAAEAGRDDRVRARVQALEARFLTGTFRWSPRTVRLILQNPAYRGELTYNRTTGERRLHGRLVRRGRAPDDWVSIACTPLVSPDEWVGAQEAGAVQNRLPRRSQTSRFLLSGRAVCGVCGAPLRGCAARPGAGRRGGDPKGYYVCRAAAEGGAHAAVYIRATDLEASVLGALREHLGRVTWPAARLRRGGRADRHPAAVAGALQDLAEARFFRRELLRKGHLSAEQFRFELGLIEQRECELQRPPAPPPDCSDDLDRLLHLEGSTDQVKTLLGALVDRITVFPQGDVTLTASFTADEPP